MAESKYEKLDDLSIEELEELESDLYELQEQVDGLWTTVADTAGREECEFTDDVSQLVEDVADVCVAVTYERERREAEGES